MQKTFNIDYESAFTACQKALRSLDFGINKSIKSKGIISASTTGGLLSWGEEIEVTIHEINNSKVKITVKSEAQAQLISWGKNDSNESSILKKIAYYINK